MIGTRRVRQSEDWGGLEGELEGCEGRGLRVGPKEFGVLAGEEEERMSNMRIFLDETVVKVAEAEEALDVFEGCGSRPIVNCL